jgi:ring-1,2-phenylacetyl-CoA epoxidase subunit PaaB
MDSQWQRFEVFKQDAPTLPHQNVGTVHAPDAEIALLNARDVFGRRPSCVSLWVVPERAILSATAEELAADGIQQALAAAKAASTDQPLKTYQVFQKMSQKRSMTFVLHVGEVQAATLQHALARAIETYGMTDVFVWWVCAADAITQSDESDVGSWFAPANDKAYRQQSYYGNVKRLSRDERTQIAQQERPVYKEETR